MTHTNHTDSAETRFNAKFNTHPYDKAQHIEYKAKEIIKFIKAEIKKANSQQVEEAVRNAENKYRFDIEGKIYLAKELVKHIEHHDKLNASFERGRVNAFEEMLQALTPNHQD